MFQPMHRCDKLPDAFRKFRKAGGVLDFHVFEDCGGRDDEILQGMRSVAPDMDITVLQKLGSKKVRKRKFLGGWIDAETGYLIRREHVRTHCGKQLVNPTLKSLDNHKVAGSAGGIPAPGEGGQFAYAFSQPPYPLRATGADVQNMFDEVLEFILPAQHDHDIRDWSNPKLPQASDYFADGMEWWGVFLFSIYVLDLRRLAIIAASATD